MVGSAMDGHICDMYNVFVYHRYIKELEKGLSVSSMPYTYSPGGSTLNHDFIWRLTDDCAFVSKSTSGL